jgi:hypothetical protein
MTTPSGALCGAFAEVGGARARPHTGKRLPAPLLAGEASRYLALVACSALAGATAVPPGGTATPARGHSSCLKLRPRASRGCPVHLQQQPNRRCAPGRRGIAT